MLYRFQFNHDVESCIALASMIKDGWHIQEYLGEDGYSWLILGKEAWQMKNLYKEGEHGTR